MFPNRSSALISKNELMGVREAMAFFFFLLFLVLFLRLKLKCIPESLWTFFHVTEIKPKFSYLQDVSVY